MPKIACLALALALAGAALNPALLFALPVLTSAALIAYRRRLAQRPYATCRPCKGTGYRLSRVFASSTGYCPDCLSTGRRLRPGARLLNVR
ncbi:hypothetical protein JOL79_30950 [Microbispora sp. RL4-1S]|uniref:Uncharacterized protein n=1 Tax=Microbispora oryzae TaxID=2806554 RepID=A0A941AMB3_9ACTN|nr:hypothetical protein [Microbispora oryzae]MBP2708207.1 hypothetical protein [Microbispora oryzae]